MISAATLGAGILAQPHPGRAAAAQRHGYLRVRRAVLSLAPCPDRVPYQSVRIEDQCHGSVT